jgi:hypothetical protein
MELSAAFVAETREGRERSLFYGRIQRIRTRAVGQQDDDGQ